MLLTVASAMHSMKQTASQRCERRSSLYVCMYYRGDDDGADSVLRYSSYPVHVCQLCVNWYTIVLCVGHPNQCTQSCKYFSTTQRLIVFYVEL